MIEEYLGINKEEYNEIEVKNAFFSYYSGDASALDKLIKLNARLVKFIIKTHYGAFKDKEELYSVGLFGLYKAVIGFDINKGYKFSTYASKVIINEINSFLKSERKEENKVSLNSNIGGSEDLILEDVIEDENFDLVSMYEENELRYFLIKSLSALNEREKYVVISRFGIDNKKEKTQCEVAKILGVSQSYVLKLERKALKKLRNELIKSGYLDESYLKKLKVTSCK